jgi:hypothetical protein
MARVVKRRGYVVNGRQVILRVDPEFELIPVPDEADEADEWNLDATADLKVAPAAAPPDRYRLPGEGFAVVRRAADGEKVFVNALSEEAGPAEPPAGRGNVRPVFYLGRHHRAVATHRMVVEAAEGEVVPLIRPYLDRRLGREGYEIEAQTEPETAVVRVRRDVDLFTLSARLRRRPGVASAQPDFITLYNPVAPPGAAGENETVPAEDGDAPAVLANLANGGNGGDPMVGLQHALQLIGAEGLEQRGHETALIAVLDATVDPVHPDLQPALKPVVDVLPAGTAAVPDPHATACAGLIAAVAGNGIGGRGVAAGCKLLPVRFALACPGNPIAQSLGSGVDAASAVDAAREAGAWVISLSWVFLENPKLRKAIERARAEGRGGKGCVVVAAAGNDGGPTYFPARMAGVVGVGASDYDNRGKTLTTPPGNWETCKGAISVAAPGVANFTTDVTGPAGYNRSIGSAGDFVHDFCGTSAAAPLVAAAAALVLCANPCLREEHVRDILCRTASRTEGLKYNAEGRNARIGFGILNVGAAVAEALRLRTGEVPCPDPVQ